MSEYLDLYNRLVRTSYLSCQDFAAFVQDVKDNGIHPLIVADDMTIIGGHRRYYAALALSLKEVDVAIFNYETETDKLAALIADNNVRVKSNWQMANEAQALIGIAGERAKRRQEIGRLRLGNAENIALVEELVPQPNGRGPQARDEVGALLGFSGRTVGDMLTVKMEIDSLEQAGDDDEAERLREKLNRNVKQTAREVRSTQVPQANAPKPKTWITLTEWNGLEADEHASLLAANGGAKFNRQDTDNIEWAQWSWNPVTGCLHNCSYCYARDIASRFYERIFGLVQQTCADIVLELPRVQAISERQSVAVEATHHKVDAATFDFIENAIWEISHIYGQEMFKRGFELGKNPGAVFDLPDTNNLFSA
jgi:ParB-like chromosome segregation protein Spo0J